MPSSIDGVPIYLAMAIVCFAVVIVMELARGGLRRRAPASGPMPVRGQGSMLQTVAAILGIISFVMQVLQWLKIM